MDISSTVSTAKERKTSGLPIRAKTSPGKVTRTRVHNTNTGGTTGTFVYLKTRRGIKSEFTQKAPPQWPFASTANRFWFSAFNPCYLVPCLIRV